MSIMPATVTCIVADARLLQGAGSAFVVLAASLLTVQVQVFTGL